MITTRVFANDLFRYSIRPSGGGNLRIAVRPELTVQSLRNSGTLFLGGLRISLPVTGTITIGSSKACAIVILDANIGAKHLSVKPLKKGILISKSESGGKVAVFDSETGKKIVLLNRPYELANDGSIFIELGRSAKNNGTRTIELQFEAPKPDDPHLTEGINNLFATSGRSLPAEAILSPQILYNPSAINGNPFKRARTLEETLNIFLHLQSIYKTIMEDADKKIYVSVVLNGMTSISWCLLLASITSDHIIRSEQEKILRVAIILLIPLLYLLISVRLSFITSERVEAKTNRLNSQLIEILSCFPSKKLKEELSKMDSDQREAALEHLYRSAGKEQLIELMKVLSKASSVGPEPKQLTGGPAVNNRLLEEENPERPSRSVDAFAPVDDEKEI
ncbi:MAG: hypothetical protein WC624_02635 [Candidatus Margulisiibacteriota bacterium]